MILRPLIGLITDISSVWIDFLLRGRPMIFAFPDLKQYRSNRGLQPRALPETSIYLVRLCTMSVRLSLTTLLDLRRAAMAMSSNGRSCVDACIVIPMLLVQVACLDALGLGKVVSRAVGRQARILCHEIHIVRRHVGPMGGEDGWSNFALRPEGCLMESPDYLESCASLEERNWVALSVLVAAAMVTFLPAPEYTA